MLDWCNVYQFPQQENMYLELHQNKIYYRSKDNTKRISYQQLKNGLIKKQIVLQEDIPF